MTCFISPSALRSLTHRILTFKSMDDFPQGPSFRAPELISRLEAGSVVELLHSTVHSSCIQAPVNNVEEQVGQWKYNPGVRVNHIAVAHDEADVLL